MLLPIGAIYMMSMMEYFVRPVLLFFGNIGAIFTGTETTVTSG